MNDGNSRLPRAEAESAGAALSNLRFHLLGTVTVRWGERYISIGTPQRRAVLVMLLLHGSRGVTCEEMAAALWPLESPPSASSALRGHVSRIRTTLSRAAGDSEDVRLEAYGDGYRLLVDRCAVDLDVFRSAVSQARRARRRGELSEAADLYRRGLALWRGRPLSGIDTTNAPLSRYFQIRRDWLEQLRSSAIVDRLAVEVESGHHFDVLAELENAVVVDPYHERLWELLIQAQYGAGRVDDAVASYLSIRETLGNDLGLNPGPGLHQLYQRLLGHRSDRRCAH